MPMVIFMKENGLTIKLTEKEHTFIKMGQNILVNGMKTNKTVTELKPGLMVPVLKALTSMEKSMAVALSNGLTNPCLLVSSTTTTFMERECICGLMVENTKVTGRKIKCMVAALLLGVMDANTWVSMLKIKSMDMESLSGLMVVPTKVTGKTASNTVKGCM